MILASTLLMELQSARKEEHTRTPGYDDYGGAVVPVAPLPVMSSSQMYGNVPDGYDSESNVYASGSSTTEIQNSESDGHKAKAHLSKHKRKHQRKHHTTKQHKTEKKIRSIKVDKNS